MGVGTLSYMPREGRVSCRKELLAPFRGDGWMTIHSRRGHPYASLYCPYRALYDPIGVEYLSIGSRPYVYPVRII